MESSITDLADRRQLEILKAYRDAVRDGGPNSKLGNVAEEAVIDAVISFIRALNGKSACVTGGRLREPVCLPRCASVEQNPDFMPPSERPVIRFRQLDGVVLSEGRTSSMDKSGARIDLSSILCAWEVKATPGKPNNHYGPLRLVYAFRERRIPFGVLALAPDAGPERYRERLREWNSALTRSCGWPIDLQKSIYILSAIKGNKGFQAPGGGVAAYLCKGEFYRFFKEVVEPILE